MRSRGTRGCVLGILVRLSLALIFIATTSAARADILDSETWDNRIEQVMQIQNDRQFRRTMHRGFDVMSTIGGSSGVDERSSVSPSQQRTALWHMTLTVSPVYSRHELDVF